MTNEVNPVTLPLENSNELRVLNNGGLADGSSVFTCNEDWSLKSRNFTNEYTGTGFTALRIENRIDLEGKFKGENIKKELKIDGKPWYQMLPLVFVDFIKSGKESLEFWMVQKEKMEAVKMALKRVQDETVVIAGKEYDTVHIEHTPAGPMTLFWKADYWVRKTDGVYVRFKGLTGPPGSPAKLMELAEE